MAFHWLTIGLMVIQYLQQHGASSDDQCNIIFHINFENCRLGVNDSTVFVNKAKDNHCTANNICDREFKMTYIELEPYYMLQTEIVKMMKFCCGSCARIKVLNTFDDLSKITVDTIAGSDFIFPFLGPVDAEQLHGFHFIPIFDTPSAFYITGKKQSPKEMLFNLIRACADLWPLLLICLLMALISGFVAWILETWENTEEFPRPFYSGLFEGFWWSFISMTTVGYGDKSPRSWPARIFSIFWILIGITICSMFTASLTTEITSAMTPKIPEIQGNKVGWLRGRLYEAMLIAQYGGTLYTINDQDWYEGIRRLFKLVSDGTVDGIVLDTYIFNLFKMTASNTSQRNYDKSLHDNIVNKTTHTEIFNKGEKLSFGMLVDHAKDNNYFRKYFIDNHLKLETCNSLALNVISDAKTEDNMLFSVEAGVFWPFFGGCVGVLALICCFGFVFEMVRRKVICHAMSVGIEGGEGGDKK